MRIKRTVSIRNGQKFNLLTVLAGEGTALPENAVIKAVQCLRVQKEGKPIDETTVVNAKVIYQKYFVEVTRKDENIPSSMVMVSLQYGTVETFRTQEVADDEYSVELQVDIEAA